MRVEMLASPTRAKVHVAPNELYCGQRKYPFATCVGVVHLERGTVDVFVPVGYRPRGYHRAAERLLTETLKTLQAEACASGKGET